MKRPVFSQLDRLADYGIDEWQKERQRRDHRKRTHAEIQELLREEGLARDQKDEDASS